MQPTIIGVGGTNGAGKDTVGEILVQRFGYLFISVTEFLRDEARRRGLSTDRANTRAISAEWRRSQGMAVLVDKALEQFNLQPVAHKGLVVASLRHPAEADRIHNVGGVMLWLDADPRLRYDRIQANVAQRNRAEDDQITFEQFLADEASEMHPSGDAATLDSASVRERADLTIINNYSNEEELAAELEKCLGLHPVVT